MKRALVAVAVLVGAACAVQADTPWENPTGSAASFTWANGYNTDTNLFGSPDWYGGDNLYFTDSDFAPYADDGGASVTATDTMNVDLLANTDLKFLSVSIYEYGDYSITGGAGNSVSADLLMTGTAAHPMSPFVDSFSFSAAGEGAGAWDENATLLLSMAVPDVTQLHLEVTNTLVALSDGMGGTASISGNFVLLGISVEVIPEPTSLALMTLGAVGVLWRRR